MTAKATTPPPAKAKISKIPVSVRVVWRMAKEAAVMPME
jgi:hypothetical protein